MKNTLSERLISARKDKNWTQLDLAKAIKVNIKNVSRWELDQAKPNIETAALIANALDISLDVLAGLKNDSNKEPLVTLLQKKVSQLTTDQKNALKTVILAF